MLKLFHSALGISNFIKVPPFVGTVFFTDYCFRLLLLMNFSAINNKTTAKFIYGLNRN